MKAYIDGYKNKLVTLLRLCLESKEYGHLVCFDYSPYLDHLDIIHSKDNQMIKYFSIELDLSDYAVKLDESIDYINKLIEGDANVCT